MTNLGKVQTIGNAWITMLKHIKQNGVSRDYSDNVFEKWAVTEVFGTTMTISNMSLPDEIIDKYKNQADYDWMVNNFTVKGGVKELFGQNSYATRFYDYMGQKDQYNWVINRLKENPTARSATITTFEPLTDHEYIPCVSMLDFSLVESGNLDLYVYCRSLQFGTKAYINLVMLFTIMKSVAEELGVEVNDMHLIVKSAHINDSDEERIDEILSDF